MKVLGKYSFGLGDRFGHQGSAQLRAIISASAKGIELTPVWNKSNREHNTIGTVPSDVRLEADTVTAIAKFNKPYFVDADHINLETVDRFIDSSDFFTIDVASYIGKKAAEEKIEKFITDSKRYTSGIKIPGSILHFETNKDQIRQIADKYLYAVIMAGEIYRKIEVKKGRGNFISEISMDEVARPQSPVELFFILKMIAGEGIPAQTIAPKFSGRFNKGVDYIGDQVLFRKEFEEDLSIIEFAVKEFGLPEELKLSIHSGSDKFAIYPSIGAVIMKMNKGIHVKTAGTTWLEEIIGLAESGGQALTFTKEIYIEALRRIEELTGPYADVIDIRPTALPAGEEIIGWSSKRFSEALTHNLEKAGYNSDMRQLMHVAYKLAAERKDEYFGLLEMHEERIAECVYCNIYDRHIRRLFGI
jgi:tagaturonate epimerase